MLESLLDYLVRNPPGEWMGPLLMLVAFVETLFPPLPGDVLFVVLSGWSVSGGGSPVAAAAWGTAGCLVSSFLLFLLGRSPVRRLVEPWLMRRVRQGRYDRARELLRRRGPLILVASRFLPGIRSLLVVLAGMSGMRLSRAAPAVTLSATAWYALMAAGGSVVGRSLPAARGLMRRFELWVWAAILVSAVIALLFHLRGRESRCR